MSDIEEILTAVDEGYIKGIHRYGGRKLIERYFDNEFSMFLRDDNDNVNIMKIQEWIERIEKRKKEDPGAYENRDVDYKIKNVNIFDGFATVLLELFYNGSFFALDLFTLYKLNGSWKFIGKVYKM